ncbi:MAG: phosphatidylglycerophosphatase A [Prevotella sp. AG:487_50_53]|jgi:phosphatidylglycerophosphatase A|uniref:Phosphatidylglycerophosphatase A n=1 Tax=Leyella lascolaii TaxID=1776379 RepID=A0AAW7JQW8_9BACT|nr:phosphatidylglycerophosphatase A [Leyella lascolaii]MDN0023852.1 phosphatidylglycerophosphatase A [Leyella lascolaii]MDN0026406.1 phosphatidylglycerophosphatase A [Leyella lascolaii]OKZ28425.1 MAG: phosphatidylglycerophosphatase A [Prevotella sp. AG:487_50_53]CCZ14259.1 phosphatidylglycerophosphatase A [Prevotella sp. CAG:487]
MKKLPLLPTIIGTGFGSGFWPWGPGTAGALTGMLIWYALSFMLNSTLLFAVTLSCIVVFTIAGTWAVRRLSPFWGSDPQKVVIDEMVGVWVPLLAVPASDIWLALASFVLFRLFDILKPLGIRTLDRRKGAFYVMADDILAGVYSLIIIVAVQWII